MKIASCKEKTPQLGRFFYQAILNLSLLLLLASWMAPDHFPPWISWRNETLAFASSLLMSVAIFGYPCEDGKILLPRAVWPMVVLLGVTALQCWIGQLQFVGDAIVYTFYFLLAIQAITAGYTAARENYKFGSGDLIQSFAIVIVIGGSISAIVAFAQAVDVWEADSWIATMHNLRRPGGNLAQPNQLATLLLFALVGVVYLFESSRLRVLAAVTVTLLLLAGLAITESRSGAIGLGVISMWWWIKRKGLSSRLNGRVVVSGLFFYAFCLCLWPILIGVVQEGGWGQSASARVDVKAGLRLIVWPQFWYAVMMHPWFGWGLGQVSAAHNAVLDLYSESGPFTYAHSLVLDSLIGVGVPLTVLFTFTGLRWLWSRAQGIRTHRGWYAFACLIPFCIHSLLEFPFAYSYLLFPAMVMLGVLEAEISPSSTFRMSRKIALGVWLITASIAAWSVVEYIEIEEDFRVVRFESLRLGHTPQDYERPHIHLLTQLGALLDAGRIKPKPDMAPDEIALAREVAMKYPWPATQNRYALSLALNGEAKEAVRQLKVIRVMHGEAHYKIIAANWRELAETKYPLLKAITIP